MLDFTIDELEQVMKGLKSCPQCGAELIQDIFQLPKDPKNKGGRLIEAKACDFCKIVYEVIS